MVIFLYRSYPLKLIPLQNLIPINFLLIFLRLFLLYILVIIELTPGKFLKTNKTKNFLLIALLAICIFTFLRKEILNFYIYFEISLIPIFLLILGWGYQPERKYARIIIFFYTLRFSLPLLGIIFFLHVHSIVSFDQLNFLVDKIGGGPVSFTINRIIFIAFLVKFPLYGFHIWLPQAHVEAPVEGSIILAAVLLKLGAIGIYNFSYFITCELFFSFFILFFSLGGGRLAIFLCIQQTDIKIIIAYSSVGHMALAISLFFLDLPEASAWIIIILVVHGNLSAALFYLINLKYEISNSRNLFFNGGYSIYISYFNFFCFSLLLFNIAGPPRISIFIEIASCIYLLDYNFLLIIPLFIFLLIRIIFNIKLFCNTQKKNKPNALKNFGRHYQNKYLISFMQIIVLLLFPLWFILFI